MTLSRPATPARAAAAPGRHARSTFLLGYRNHGDLGHYELHSPRIVLADEVPDVIPAVDLYDELDHIQVQRR